MALSMSGRIKVRKPLSMKRARTVDITRQRLMRGQVTTGSEFDGWHIRTVFESLRQCYGQTAAMAMTKSVWKNRGAAYRARQEGS